MSQRIPYTKPSITELEVSLATDAARNGWGEHCYDYIVRFEDAFSRHLDVRHSIATSSCTGALHMGLSAMGVGPGDEVIMADTNWIATAAPVVHLGATPVFVDILEGSWCIDPALAEAAVTPRTKAIIATHLYGNLCNMDHLLAIGREHGIPIIEDAAEAIGSVYDGKRAGSMGNFGTFSFHGTKTLTTGEGGMFVTNDPDLHEKVLSLSNHGRVRGQTRQFWPDLVGFKYKMSNVQAAIGCAQVERIDELIARKREIFQFYADRLLGIPGISMNSSSLGGASGYWMPNVVFGRGTGVTSDLARDAFVQQRIDARVFFWPLSHLPIFGGHPGQPIASDIANRSINLPTFHEIETEQLLRVVDIIKQLCPGA